MERKTTQRIIGVLVVVALVIVLLPLLFNGNSSLSNQTSEVKAPPFPDQSASPQASAVSSTPADTITNPSPTASPTASLATDTSAAAAPTLADNNTLTPPPVGGTPPNGLAPEPAPNTMPTTPNTTPPMPNTVTPAPNTVPATPAPEATTPTAEPTKTSDTTQSLNVPAMTNSETVATPTPETTAPEEATKQSVKVKVHRSPKHFAQKPQELNNLKNAAWVVQMGSFKNKINAIRLTNRLRAQGYKAFTRETKSSMRVYVGPEVKQASAASLANKIEQQLNMHGIVVSFKPLEL